MRARFLLILSAALLCNGECVEVGPRLFGRVEVSAFSSVGESIPNLQIELTEVGTKKSFKSQFHGAVARKIPYGIYTLSVRSLGFNSVQREVQVNQPEVSVRTQLWVGAECGGFDQIVGAVQPSPQGRELWIKLVPVRGVGGTEVRVNRDGSFLASSLDAGHYLLLVLDGEKIVYTESVDALSSQPLIVNLASE